MAGLMDTKHRSGKHGQSEPNCTRHLKLADGQVTHIHAAVSTAPVVAPGEWGRHSERSSPSRGHKGRLLEGINNTQGIPSEQWGGNKASSKKKKGLIANFLDFPANLKVPTWNIFLSEKILKYIHSA